MKLEKNLGNADKIVRLIVAAVILVLFLFRIISGPIAAGLIALSAVLVITVLLSFCPVYQAFGVNHRDESSA